MSVKKKVNLFESFGHSENCFLRKDGLSPKYKGSNLWGVCPSYTVLYAAYSPAVDSVFACTDRTIGASGSGTSFTNFTGYPCETHFLIEAYVEGTLRAIIIAGKTAVVYMGDWVDDIPMKVELTCGLMHCGRLFGANEYEIWWSGPDGFNDFVEREVGTDGCGHLTLDSTRGKVINMLEYDGKILIVQEFGLTVFSAEGSPDSYTVLPTETNTDYLYKGSACVAGGKVYFMTISGLKCFDGKKISSVNIRHKISMGWSSAVYGSIYYLACRSEHLQKSVILCLDTKDGETCLVNEYSDALYALEGLRFFDYPDHKLLANGGSLIYESADIDFDTTKFKTLTEIQFDGTATITVNNGRHTRVFENKTKSIRPRVRGRSFVVTIESSEPVKFATATAEVTE